jgi:hypothetical protein
MGIMTLRHPRIGMAELLRAMTAIGTTRTRALNAAPDAVSHGNASVIWRANQLGHCPE